MADLVELRKENERLIAELRQRRLFGVPQPAITSSVDRLLGINAALAARLQESDSVRQEMRQLFGLAPDAD